MPVLFSECADKLQLLETNYSDVTCADYQMLRNIPPEDCKRRGCQLKATSLAYANWVCRLYFCEGEPTLNISLINWKIYVVLPRISETFETKTDAQITVTDRNGTLETNTYPHTGTTDDTVQSTAKSFPDWALPVAGVGSVVLTSVIVCVAVWKRKRNPQR